MKEESPSAARIQAALGELLPSGAAAVVWSGTDGVEPPLGSSERAAVENAVPKRRLEFARGRSCAREALAVAGWEGGFVEIPVGPARQPIWPAGFTGSITHCEGLVAAVVVPYGREAGARGVEAIGVDAEPARPLPEDVRDQILTPEERALPGAETGMVVFSAKESVHKAVHPRSGVWLDFLDIVLTLDRERGTFRAAPAPGAKATTPEVDALVGRYLLIEGFVLTLAYLPG